MGDYTGIRFTAKLKPAVANAMRVATDRITLKKEGSTKDWWTVICYMTDVPVDSSFMLDSRRDFIPFGGIVYMPQDWVQHDAISCDSDGIWKVSCSLKNYSNTIAKFLEFALPYMIEEPCEVETHYEMDDASKFFKILPR